MAQWGLVSLGWLLVWYGEEIRDRTQAPLVTCLWTSCSCRKEHKEKIGCRVVHHEVQAARSLSWMIPTEKQEAHLVHIGSTSCLSSFMPALMHLQVGRVFIVVYLHRCWSGQITAALVQCVRYDSIEDAEMFLEWTRSKSMLPGIPTGITWVWFTMPYLPGLCMYEFHGIIAWNMYKRKCLMVRQNVVGDLCSLFEWFQVKEQEAQLVHNGSIVSTNQRVSCQAATQVVALGV